MRVRLMPESVYSIVKRLIERNGYVTNAMIEPFGVDVVYTARNRIREYEHRELLPKGKCLRYEKGELWKENRWTVEDVKPVQMELAV